MELNIFLIDIHYKATYELVKIIYSSDTVNEKKGS